jgi:isopentenyldiphosphate isomerase
MERNTIVDENDQVIGAKNRADITKKDIYRVSGLWLYNEGGQVLLAQRSFTKSHDPGMWGPAVAGTVAEGEDYLTTITREAEEELGLTGITFEIGPKVFQSEGWKYWSQKFTAITDKDISDMKIQKEEVEQVKWFDEKELPMLIEEKPDLFIPSMRSYYKN